MLGTRRQCLFRRRLLAFRRLSPTARQVAPFRDHFPGAKQLRDCRHQLRHCERFGEYQAIGDSL